MTGHDPTGREPARHRAAVKPSVLEAAVRKPRPTFKTGLLGAVALSVATAAALLVNGCSGGSIHASSAVATAASAIGRAASAAAEPIAQAAVASAKAGAGTDASTPAAGASGSASTSAGASAAVASLSASASASADPGLLPQTRALPSTDDPQFKAGVQTLWQAIVHDDPAQAHGFFFPLSAYQQVKAISNPAADYQNRLLTWYDLDIKAAHDLLGPSAADARLVDVQVPAGQAQWITPGTEYNKGSYYRVLGSRLVYQENGHIASFGIFSLISWRGEWYVVHLGPSTRSTTTGIVYEPEG